MSARVGQRVSFSSRPSSFWESDSDSDSDYDESLGDEHEYSEWRDCLRGMEAKYPRDGSAVRVATGTSGTATPAEKGEYALPRRDSQGHIAVDHAPYSDPPPAYETTVRQPPAPVPSKLSQTKNGAYLEFFLALSEDVQKNPRSVIDRISRWLLDPESPRFWIPFGLSIRGLAQEELEKYKYARQDYVEALLRFYHLRWEQGEAAVDRLKANVRFMEFRLVTLGGVVPTDKTKQE